MHPVSTYRIALLLGTLVQYPESRHSADWRPGAMGVEAVDFPSRLVGVFSFLLVVGFPSGDGERMDPHPAVDHSLDSGFPQTHEQ